MRVRFARFIAGLLLTFVPALTHASVELNYWLWDSVQLPAYRDAARVFEEENPDIQVRITQIGWDDYWISLTTALISDTAPDVFVNHPARYPALMRNGTLLDLAPRIARDGIRAQDYLGDLFAVWSNDGAHYALPKDWDTVAIVYNRTALEQAGIKPGDLDNLDWNPLDGGSFARVLARLSRDEAGRRGNAPEFDGNRVDQYGLLLDGLIDGFGQDQWSHLAASNGFRFCDGAWSREFHYDDPRLAETLVWLRGAMDRGWVAPARDSRRIAPGLFAANRGVLAFCGSWMIDWYARNCRFEIGFAPLPHGPLGRRSMFNGLGDSIWIGTRHPEEAWRWVRFLGSREGQSIIAGHGVVFPAIREAAGEAVAAMNRKGPDVRVFLRQATEPDGTFRYPLTENGSDIRSITIAAMDRIFLRKEPADVAQTLARMNREVNALFERAP